MKISGLGEVYESDSLLGTVHYELEFGVGRSGRHECTGRVKPKEWTGVLSGRKGLVLRLDDGRQFDLEGHTHSRISNWNLVHGIEAPKQNI
jgi:hypothetical protein